jgi:hypothetical protein
MSNSVTGRSDIRVMKIFIGLVMIFALSACTPTTMTPATPVPAMTPAIPSSHDGWPKPCGGEKPGACPDRP